MDTKSGAYQAMVWITVCALFCFVISAMSVAVTIRNKIDHDYKPLKSEIEANSAILKAIAEAQGANVPGEAATFSKDSPFYTLNQSLSTLAVVPQNNSILFAKNADVKTPKAITVRSPRGGLTDAGTVRILDEYLPPVINQGAIGDCWLNSLLRTIESSYVRNGIKKGYLEPNQWVNFSRQHMEAVLINACDNKNPPSWCNGGLSDTGDVTVIGGNTEILYYAQELIKNHLLPTSECTYSVDATTHASELLCNNTKKSALDFASDLMIPMGDVSLAMYTKWEQAYDRLKQTEGDLPAMVFNFPILADPVTIDCNVTSAVELCSIANIDSMFPCPNDSSHVCVSPIINSFDIGNGIFVAGQQAIVDDGHSVILAGITLDTPIITKDIASSGVKTGGIVVANSWGQTGHSLEYFLGFRTLDDEQNICGQGNFDPLSWVDSGLPIYAISEYTPPLGRMNTNSFIDGDLIKNNTAFTITDIIETDQEGVVDIYLQYSYSVDETEPKDNKHPKVVTPPAPKDNKHPTPVTPPTGDKKKVTNPTNDKHPTPVTPPTGDKKKVTNPTNDKHPTPVTNPTGDKKKDNTPVTNPTGDKKKVTNPTNDKHTKVTTPTSGKPTKSGKTVRYGAAAGSPLSDISFEKNATTGQFIVETKHDNGTITYTKTIVIKSFPLRLLGAYFTPNDPSKKTPTYAKGADCYYYFIPFDYLNAAQAFSNSLTIDEFHIEFPDEAYYSVSCGKNAKNAPKWCESLKANTFEKTVAPLTGVLPTAELPKAGGNVIFFK